MSPTHRNAISLVLTSIPWALLFLPPKGDSLDRPLVFLVTANREGYLQACGCSQDQKDFGLALESETLSTEIDQLKASGKSAIILDAGNFTSKYEDVSSTTLKAYDQMGFKAVHVTAQDLKVDPNVLDFFVGRSLFAVSADHRGLPKGHGVISTEGAPSCLIADARDPQVDLKTIKQDVALVFIEEDRPNREIFDRLPFQKPVLLIGPNTGDQVSANYGASLFVTAPEKGAILECEYDPLVRRFTFVKNVPVIDNGRRDSHVDSIVKEHYVRAIKSMQGHSEVAGITRGDFSPAISCQSCHYSAYEKWHASGHASALQTLVKKDRVVPECIPCHVTSYRNGDAFDTSDLVSRESVSCESCHGPGNVHVATQRKSDIVARPAKDVCLKCHNTDTSPRFDYAKALSKITH